MEARRRSCVLDLVSLDDKFKPHHLLSDAALPLVDSMQDMTASDRSVCHTRPMAISSVSTCIVGPSLNNEHQFIRQGSYALTSGFKRISHNSQGKVTEHAARTSRVGLRLEAGPLHHGISRPSSQLMNLPERAIPPSMDRFTSYRTRIAPTEGSTAPSTSQIAEYLAVMSVRLKPGWSNVTTWPSLLSSSLSSTPAMLHAARDM
mmetsp:Transcript_23054/g.70601  ORF Transcript_23054/g.70601 Transcript_23054/m.70601 type:complete len:204 (-) Transcript_23054:672-1283(-)